MSDGGDGYKIFEFRPIILHLWFQNHHSKYSYIGAKMKRLDETHPVVHMKNFYEEEWGPQNGKIP